MAVQRDFADHCRLSGGFAPAFAGALGKTAIVAEPLVWLCVSDHNQFDNQCSSKGPSTCQSKTFSSPSQLVQVLPLAVTPLASKRSAAVRSVRVRRQSQAEAFCKVLQSARAQTFLPASLAQSAVSNTDDAAAFGGRTPRYHKRCPAQPVLTRGFSVSSRPKGTAHVR